MHAVLVAILLAINSPTPTIDEKTAIGEDLCYDIASDAGYDDCTVELNASGERMWFHMHCYRWDAEKEIGFFDENAILEYRWDANRITLVKDTAMVGCPVLL